MFRSRVVRNLSVLDCVFSCLDLMPPKTYFARFTPFSRGTIIGMAEAGVAMAAIRKAVLKKDGRRASLRAIDACIAKARSDPTWQGEDSSAGGRPSALTPSQVCQLKQLIHDEVGLAKVTIPYMRKRLPFLKKVTKHSHPRTHARAHARPHARTHARTHEPV